MSSPKQIIYVVDEADDTYHIVCKGRFFDVKSDRTGQKRTNFPKICSFAIDSYYWMLYSTILDKE